MNQRRSGPPPRPQDDGTAGEPQLLAEILAVVIANTDSDTLLISADQRWRLQELFPNGFALAAVGDRNGEIKVSLLGPESAGLTAEMVQDINNGVIDRIPAFLSPNVLTAQTGDNPGSSDAAARDGPG